MRNVIELYRRGMSAEALAQAVIAEYFDGKEPSFGKVVSSRNFCFITIFTTIGSQ